MCLVCFPLASWNSAIVVSDSRVASLPDHLSSGMFISVLLVSHLAPNASRESAGSPQAASAWPSPSRCSPVVLGVEVSHVYSTLRPCLPQLHAMFSFVGQDHAR